MYVKRQCFDIVAFLFSTESTAAEHDRLLKQINNRTTEEPTLANDGSKTFLMSAMCGYGFVALRNAISAVGRSREIAEDRTIRMAPGDTSVGSTHRSSDEKTKNEPCLSGLLPIMLSGESTHRCRVSRR